MNGGSIGLRPGPLSKPAKANEVTRFDISHLSLFSGCRETQIGWALFDVGCWFNVGACGMMPPPGQSSKSCTSCCPAPHQPLELEPSWPLSWLRALHSGRKAAESGHPTCRSAYYSRAAFHQPPIILFQNSSTSQVCSPLLPGHAKYLLASCPKSASQRFLFMKEFSLFQRFLAELQQWRTSPSSALPRCAARASSLSCHGGVEALTMTLMPFPTTGVERPPEEFGSL